MKFKKIYTLNELRDYSSLFSRSEVMRWYSNDFSSIRTKIERYSPPIFSKKISYLSFLKHAYSVLEKFYPNEYVYKNEFINKWLIAEIGKSDSVIYNEFRLGKAIADLVMFNGNSKVFEIKTLLDKETRLSSQIIQYSKVFNEVYIIVPELKLEKYLSCNPDVGVISYCESKSEFELIRKSKLNSILDPDVLMEILHTNEYVSIVENCFGERPKFHDFNKFHICKELIKKIPSEILNKEFIKHMKLRKRKNEFSKKDTHLNQILLSLNYDEQQKLKLINNLRKAVF